MKNAVIIFSGGLDSTTVLAFAKANGYNCHTITFDYGQRHRSEVANAAKVARANNVVKHHEVKLDIGQFGGSALTDPNIAVPEFKESNDIPITYVPARNTVFLSIALSLAETIKASAIFCGASFVDYSGYPDCRPEYFAAFNNLIKVATKATVSGDEITIYTPLLHLSKAETIKLGISLGVDYSKTISCYNATADGKACGKCDSCILRKKGFSAANTNDPTEYINL